MKQVLLNLTHLPLTEINNQYLIFFIDVGNFENLCIIFVLFVVLAATPLEASRGHLRRGGFKFENRIFSYFFY